MHSASELRIGIWIKPEEEQAGRILFTYGLDGATLRSEFVDPDRAAELRLPAQARTGDELAVLISTPHRASRNGDLRDLSFIMSSLCLL